MTELVNRKEDNQRIPSLLSGYGNGIWGLVQIFIWAIASFIGLKSSKNELDQKEKDMLIWAKTLKRQHQQKNKR